MMRSEYSVRGSGLPGYFTLLLLAASCATGPAPSAVILARSTSPLLDTPVLFQRIFGQDDDAPYRLDVRAMPRRLVVTDKELTLPGGNGNQLTPWEFTLSFSTVETVEAGTIHYDPLGIFGRGTNVSGVVTVTDQRGVCKTACVFLFRDSDGEPDPATAERFAEIVRTGRESVDPYGRNDGPRQVAAAFGLRAPRPVWHRSLSDESSDVRATADGIERAVLRYAKSTLRSDFRQCLTTTLNAQTDSGGAAAWRYAPIGGVSVNRKTELDTSSILKSSGLKQLNTNSMLVADIYGLGFTYIAPAGTDPARVEVIFRAYVDFYDLEPLKDGRYFWFDYTVQRLMADLIADAAASVRADVGHLCNALSARIREEITQRPGESRDKPAR